MCSKVESLPVVCQRASKSTMLPLVSPQKASKQEAQAAIRPEAQGGGGTALMESKAIKSQANRYWEDEDDGDERKSTRQ